MRPARATPEQSTDQLRPVAVTRHVDRWRLLRLILGVQGLYYVVTGLWPFLHLRSFLWVVGPKLDRFQLSVTAALIVAIGTSLLAAAVRSRPSASAAVLSIGSALAFIAVDLRFRPILRAPNWVDFALEVGFAFACALAYLAAVWQERRRL